MRLRKEALLRKHWGSSGIKGGSLGTAKERSLGTAKEGSLGTAKEGSCSLSCQRALTQRRTLGRWFECPSSLLERLQRRIALEALCERRSSLGSEVVATETAGVASRGGW